MSYTADLRGKDAAGGPVNQHGARGLRAAVDADEESGHSRASCQPAAACHPANMLRTTNQTLAGRSARRRMYHGNQ